MTHLTVIDSHPRYRYYVMQGGLPVQVSHQQYDEEIGGDVQTMIERTHLAQSVVALMPGSGETPLIVRTAFVGIITPCYPAPYYATTIHGGPDDPGQTQWHDERHIDIPQALSRHGAIVTWLIGMLLAAESESAMRQWLTTTRSEPGWCRDPAHCAHARYW